MSDFEIDNYFRVMAMKGLHPNKGNLKFLTDSLFRDIDFRNKMFLEIRGGIVCLAITQHAKVKKK